MKIISIIAITTFLLLSCKTANTENTDSKSDIHAANYTPSKAEIDGLLDSLMNSDEFDLDENTKKIVSDVVKEFVKIAMESPETLQSILENMLENMLYVYPNPTSGAVTVEFARDFPFKSIDVNLKSGISLDLYYMGNKINTLEFSNVKDNKVIITSEYLQENGTYTITIAGLKDFSTSFVVRK
ncbi:MAG: hypothetical protein FWG85_05865 [Bacteroidetes bacterium]|nr:hypothetical protein [Bacteroidota bacterium]